MNSLISLRTNRFWTFVISIAVLAVLSGVGLALNRDGGTIAAVLTPLATFCAAALGFGSDHDKQIRVASAKAEAVLGVAEVEATTSVEVAKAPEVVS